ncbi:MAG: LysR family transcriptional regulator [Clostridia bacterium]|nr:LysR family transcriptional regulator [Clostridia bacterium]
MTVLEIECFLSICEHKTISRAAQSLYIAQPSLSSRLKTLERELGGELFVRKKGAREMTLTNAGKEFYKLALQYEELITKMNGIFNTQGEKLRVSSFNSLDTVLLPQVYDLFLQKHPDIELEIQNMELAVASLNIHKGDTDIVFTTGKTNDKGLKQTLVFCEPMVIVCNKNIKAPSTVSTQHLQKYQEVFVDWSNAYTKWHNDTIHNAHPKLTVVIMSHIKQFISNKECWAIVPISVAHGLLQDENIKSLDADFTLPYREVSIITSAKDDNNPSVKYFLDCLKEIVLKYPEIEIRL